MRITIAGHPMIVTPHVIDRYAERVRHLPTPLHPTEFQKLSDNVAYILRTHGEIATERPAWNEHASPEEERTVCWVMVGDGLSFPVVSKRGTFVVVTCITKGGLSHEKRERKNAGKKRKRAARADERQFKAWRGEKKPRWQ
jgi:hypothetical protein